MESLGSIAHNIQDIGVSVNNISTSAPLRLNGGGDTSIDCHEDAPSISPQHTFENADVSQIMNENENDLLSFDDQDNSMSE